MHISAKSNIQYTQKLSFSTTIYKNVLIYCSNLQSNTEVFSWNVPNLWY